MPAMTIPQLRRFIAEHFPQAPAEVEIEHLDDTTIRVRQKTHDRNRHHRRPHADGHG